MPVVSGTMRSRMGFAVQHLMAAANFSRQCCAVEKKHIGEPIDYFFDEIKYCSTASILFSVASLEAHINELFFEHSSSFPNHSENLIKRTFEAIEKASILKKYQMALSLRGAEDFDIGKDNSFKATEVLIRLRNALVHFKPEWEDDQKKHKTISDSLRGRFEMSPFIEKHAPIFPKKFMSYGCSKWAVNTATKFLAAFHEKADIPNKFEIFEDTLKLE